MNELLLAFEFLEEMVVENKIRNYGMVCWNVGRKLAYSPFYFDFAELYGDVEKRLGPGHNFRFIQAPLSLGMPENFCEKYNKSFQSDGMGFFFVKFIRNNIFQILLFYLLL